MALFTINPHNSFPPQKPIDFTQFFSAEIHLEIFSYLDSLDLASCTLVNKTCKVLANDERLWKALPIPEIAFGKKEWEEHFGYIVEEPEVTIKIHKLLIRRCLIWKNERVGKTHMLTLIPEAVNGKPLNLKNIEELMKNPRKGSQAQYRDIGRELMKNFENLTTGKTHWVLITKDVIAESRNQTYAAQKDLVAKFADYEVPKLLDVVISILTHFVRSGEQLFCNIDKRWTYTRCQETADGAQIVVGAYAPGQLQVFSYDDCFEVGVAMARECNAMQS